MISQNKSYSDWPGLVKRKYARPTKNAVANAEDKERFERLAPTEVTTASAAASEAFWFGALMRLTDTGGADFCAWPALPARWAGAPHVPTGDGSVGDANDSPKARSSLAWACASCGVMTSLFDAEGRG